MPLFDAKHVFSNGQAIVADAYSDNEVDFGIAGANMGGGSPLVVRFIIEETFLTTVTVQFILCHGAATAPTTQLVMTSAIAVASLTKGAYIPELKIPDQHLRYMRLYYDVSTNPTAGKITAFIDIARGMRSTARGNPT